MTKEDIQAIGTLMDNKLEPIKSDLQEVKQHVQNLDQRVQNVEQCVQNLDQRVQNLDQRVQNLDQRVQNLDQRVQNLDQHVQNLDQRVQNLDQRVDDIEHSNKAIRADIATLNHEIVPKVNAMYDGITGINEKFRRLDNLERKQEDHGDRILALEYAFQTK